MTRPLHRKTAAGSDDPTVKMTNLTDEDKARIRAALEARTGNTDVESDGDCTDSDLDK